MAKATTKNPPTKKNVPKKDPAANPAFKWQMGGLIAGIIVALASTTEPGRQALRSVGLEDVVLHYTRGKSRSPKARVDQQPLPEKAVEVIPSVCLTQPCKVKVFHNGEHEGGKSFTVSPADVEGLQDLGEWLGPKMECVSQGMRRDEPKYCKVFNRVGVRVPSMASVEDGETLYVVPQNRNFVWPTVKIGRKVTVPHVKSPLGAEVVLETLSHSPRVFSLYNFMDMEEADSIIEDALGMTQEAYRLKRSSTGTKGKAISKTRTSDNAFVTHTNTAQALKRRIFQLLGIEEYHETWADGLQVLRYNESQAYVAHFDYLESAEGHDFKSEGLGTNRFATVVLYFNDVREGGETVFTHAPGIDHHLVPDTKVPVREVLENLDLPRSGWEEKLLLQCRRHMVVAPKRGQAVLFYNQHPDGRKDLSSEHGACPVIDGQKWAANLWVWNGPRYGLSSVDPETGRTVDKAGNNIVPDPTFQVQAAFLNEDVEGASLWFDGKQLWMDRDWRIGETFKINTFLTHRWVVKVNGAEVKTWLVSERTKDQSFVLSKASLA
ncbi:conserved unknown protein [Ectocarpus siliculosus]|uniref:Fe2OG dioxygenase domain-containing protein n=1 Tax=Ectocarpus siliculosus TaxID=2880 RepID=D8LFE8_ECTSI|nr:conserved unknown protein [Ectocarpus siliculosus]|eukprot:CBN75608.1 conserved unknown protein [Ectocarpus siliculosus]